MDRSASNTSARATPPPAPVAVTLSDAPSQNAGVWSKLGSSVKKVAADRKAAREDGARAHQERAAAAGSLVTSGIFGISTVEIYEGGYVRVAEGREGRTGAAEISKSTPYEKLRSISFGASEADASRTAQAAPSSALEGAVMQAMSGIVKGGKVLTKGTAIGVAASGLNQLASNAARKSNLIIATDMAIHTLTNQQHNGWMKVSRKEHDAVAQALIEAGNAVLGISPVADHAAEPDVVAVAAIPAAAPTLSDRLRELSDLHRDGILSDEEFSTAKAKLLSGL